MDGIYKNISTQNLGGRLSNSIASMAFRTFPMFLRKDATGTFKLESLDLIRSQNENTPVC